MKSGLLATLEKPIEVQWEENPVRTLLTMLARGLYVTASVIGFLVFGMLYFIFYVVTAGIREKGFR